MWGKNHSSKSRKKMSILARGKYVGEMNPRAKLSEKDVIEIRKIYSSDGQSSYRGIAKMSGVTYGTIRNIVKRKTWNHV